MNIRTLKHLMPILMLALLTLAVLQPTVPTGGDGHHEQLA